MGNLDLFAGPAPVTDADRERVQALHSILHRYAQRDIAVSKYCAGIALTHGAPANRWHRVLNRYLRPVA